MTKEDCAAIASDLRGAGREPFVKVLSLIGREIAPLAAGLLNQEVPQLRSAGAISPDFCQTLIRVAKSEKAPERVKMGALRLISSLREMTETADDYLAVAEALVQAVPDSQTWSDFEIVPTFYDFMRVNGVCGNCKGRLKSIVQVAVAARREEMAKRHVESLLIFISQFEREQAAGRWKETAHQLVGCTCR